MRIWRDGEHIKVATDYDAAKETDLYIDGLRPDILYRLRVFGYSRGGQGAMSSPALKFMTGNNSGLRRNFFLENVNSSHFSSITNRRLFEKKHTHTHVYI